MVNVVKIIGQFGFGLKHILDHRLLQKFNMAISIIGSVPFSKLVRRPFNKRFSGPISGLFIESMSGISCGIALVLLLTFSTSQVHSRIRPEQLPPKGTPLKQSLVAVIGSYPKTLNPMIYTSDDELTIFGRYTMFEQLIITDPDTGEPICWLCSNFSYVNKAKTKLKIRLRAGIRFHDGKAMTADDVLFSYRVMVHPKTDNLNLKSNFVADVKHIEKLDALTVLVHFKSKKFSNVFTMNYLRIIPQHLFHYWAKRPAHFNRDIKFGRSPIGSGPYQFKKWVSGKYIDLIRNEKWWGRSLPEFAGLFNFKKIRFKIISDETVALNALRKGDVDFMALQSYQYDRLRKDKKLKQSKIQIKHLKPTIGALFMFIALNGRQGRFADVKTRQALALLTDRPSALNKFSRGLRPPTNGPWSKASLYQCPVSECPVLPYDPKRASELLGEAGWADSDRDGILDRKVDGKMQKLKFEVLAPQTDYYRNVMAVYVAAWRKAGIKATVKQLEYTSVLQLVDDLEYDAHFSGFRGKYPIQPRKLWHSSSTGRKGSNSWNFVSPEADLLIDQFEAEFDTQKRQALGRQIHRLIYHSHSIIFHHEGGGCFAGFNQTLGGVAAANYRSNCIFWPRWYPKSNKL